MSTASAAFSRLVDYPAASADAEASFLLKMLADRATEAGLETVARQGERGIRGVVGKNFSKPPAADHFHLKKGLKGELLSPGKWVTAALATSDSTAHKVLGRFIEGAVILVEKATPIGRAASLAILIHGSVEDALTWQQKRQDAKLALEHDIAFLELQRHLRKCVEAVEQETKSCTDVRAHVKATGAGLKDTLLNMLMASRLAELAPEGEERVALAKAMFRLLTTTAEHRNHIRYIDEQMLHVALLRRIAGTVASLVSGWASDPESIPFGELPSPQYPDDTASRWLETRRKLLDSYARRLRDVEKPLSDAEEGLEGEKFVVTLALGFVAWARQSEVPQVRRARLPGIGR